MDIRMAKRKATKEKRKGQTCKVYKCKIDKSHLSKESEKHLYMLFKEAKWFYNYCLALNAMDSIDTTIKSVPVKVGEIYENREFNFITAQMKQSIRTRLWQSLSSLSAKKKQGQKVGKLKFKSQIDSIPLVQYNRTFWVKDNKIKISGMNGKWLRVHGLHQIPKDAEIANATLVQRNKNYYIHITTFTNKEEKVVPPNASIGIDFGCETQLTFDNGIKAKFQVEPSKRLKKLDRKIMKGKRPNSKKKDQDKLKRKKEYEKLTNKKTDIRHKIVNTITKNYKFVVFQDESIHAWHSGNHGKKVQFSGIGGIISDLKHKSHTPIMVDKFFPSTQLCPNCGIKNKLGLSDRIYECNCGFKMDRDVKSAKCILAEGMKQIPMDHRELTAGEILPSAFFNLLTNIDGVEVSKVNH